MRYKDKVKYWLTFNEINCIKHHLFVSAGIVEENCENIEQKRWQSAHHQFVASALATKYYQGGLHGQLSAAGSVQLRPG
jgi:6-phospho-beta-glucosidase